MYRIAIVEDSEQDARLLMTMLDRYASEKHVQLEYRWMNSASRFLEDYHQQYGIVLFDIRMPGLDGMSAARELRAMDRSVVIVFLTSLAQYAVEGYAVEATDYILKPITYAALELKMPRILSRCQQEEPEIIIQSNGTSVKLLANELQYVEIYDHHISCGRLTESRLVQPANAYSAMTSPPQNVTSASAVHPSNACAPTVTVSCLIEMLSSEVQPTNEYAPKLGSPQIITLVKAVQFLKACRTSRNGTCTEGHLMMEVSRKGPN